MSARQGQINAELEDQGISRDGAGERLPRGQALARSARGLLGPRAGLGRQAGERAAPTAWRSTKPPFSRATWPWIQAARRRSRGGGPFELEVQVQNQGDSEEADIGVSFELTGGAQTISGDATIPRIAAGEIQTASIPIDPDPEPGQQLTLEVTVQPVTGRADRGEQPLQLPDHLRVAGIAAASSPADGHGPPYTRGRCGDADRIPGPGRNLLRGCPARRRWRGRDRCAARAQRLRGDPGRGRGRGGAGTGPVRELDRGGRPLDPRHARLRRALGDDRGRARPPDQPTA